MNRDRLGIQTVADVAAVLEKPIAELLRISSSIEQYYRCFSKPKPNRTVRQIWEPNPYLRSIQKNLQLYLIQKLRWTSVVHGGVPHRSMRTNAAPHVGQFMVATLDIRSFYPSVTERMVLEAFKRLGCSQEAGSLLVRLTTCQNQLPEGSPCSQIIGNIVLEPLDSRIMALARRHQLTYTRYVDDLTISSGKNIGHLRATLIHYIHQAGFQVSPDKIDFIPRHRRQTVTGVVVNDRIRPPQEYVLSLKREIRSSWDHSERLEMTPRQRGSVWGKLNHIKYLDKRLGREVRALLTK